MLHSSCPSCQGYIVRTGACRDAFQTSKPWAPACRSNLPCQFGSHMCLGKSSDVTAQCTVNCRKHVICIMYQDRGECSAIIHIIRCVIILYDKITSRDAPKSFPRRASSRTCNKTLLVYGLFFPVLRKRKFLRTVYEECLCNKTHPRLGIREDSGHLIVNSRASLEQCNHGCLQ